MIYFRCVSPAVNEGRNGDSKDWTFSDRCFPCLSPSPLPHPLCVHTVHVLYGKSVRVGSAGFAVHVHRTQVYIHSNPEGSGTHQVDSTGTPWEALANREYRQRRPGMLGSVGLAKGVGSPVMWHLYHSMGPSLILKQDDAVYQPLPEYAQTFIPLLILTLSHSLSHRSLQSDGLSQQHFAC